MEIDVNDKNPVKFWGLISTLLAALAGGSGFTSYTMAQQATAKTAAATAEVTARSVLEKHNIEANRRLDELEAKVEANGIEAAAISRDVQWIRDTLERIEERQYENGRDNQ